MGGCDLQTGMTKERILEILESAKDDSGAVPMALVRLAFDRLSESCNDVPDINVGKIEYGDLISRKAAIEAICKAGCGGSYCGISCDDVKAIEQLPSVQPEISIKPECYACEYCAKCEVNGYTAPEPCDDVVSRKALRQVFEEQCYPVHYDFNSVDMGMTLPGIVEVLNIVPSVTPKPKIGKWEIVEDYDGDEHFRCSECGAEFTLIDGTPEDNDYLYCPHCGSRDEMEGAEQDD